MMYGVIVEDRDCIDQVVREIRSGISSGDSYLLTGFDDIGQAVLDQLTVDERNYVDVLDVWFDNKENANDSILGSVTGLNGRIMAFGKTEEGNYTDEELQRILKDAYHAGVYLIFHENPEPSVWIRKEFFKA